MTTRDQVDATTRLLTLRDELLNATHMAGTEWWADRVEEMAYIQKQLERAGVIPAL
jgi:hypothetical protein